MFRLVILNTALVAICVSLISHIAQATKTTPRTVPEGCIIPDHPAHGKWLDRERQEIMKPGLYTKRWTAMNKVCDENFKLFTTSLVSCDYNETGHLVWRNLENIGNCRAVCPSLYSNEMTKVICTARNNRIENCTEPLDNAIAEISCKPKFKNMHIWDSKSKFRVCSNGKWDNKLLPRCIAKRPCGIKAPPRLQPLVVNGTAVNKEEYPWHVAIYQENKNKMSVICGGSLINEKLIVTAAHCVTRTNGELKDKHLFYLAAGKQFSQYDDPRDKDVQYSKVERIYIPSNYVGDSRNFVGDIAILVSTVPFIFENNTRVLPVCLNYGSEDLEEELLGNTENYGFVAGFGITETGKVSDTLKHIKLPINPVNCSIYLPEGFTDYYSYDKFCAGYINESKSVCSGDSGGGLVIQNRKDGRYYLAGVVSLSPQDASEEMFFCNSRQYSLYTKIANYRDFIFDKTYQYVKVKRASAQNESLADRECKNHLEANFTTTDPHITTNDMARGNLFPFLAYIEIQDEGAAKKRYCRGSLISNQFILTAAHCAPIIKTADISESVTIKFMHEGFEIDIFDNRFLKLVKVAEIFVHPDYEKPQIYADIALIKFEDVISFSENLRPVCLEMDLEVNVNLYQFVWTNHIPAPAHLYTQLLKTEDKFKCQQLFSRLPPEYAPEGFVDDTQICVESTLYLRGKIEKYCEPPGGYPLVVTGRGKMGKIFYKIAGLASDAGGCSAVDHLVPFTRVATFIPWIEDIVWG